MAPIASSSCPGTPSLRTMKTSSGASRACATWKATGTPPRGKPRTMTSSRWPIRRATSRPRSCPASILSRNRGVPSRECPSMVLTAAKLPLHRLNLGVKEFDLGQQFFNLLREIPDPRPPPRDAVVLVRGGQLSPQSGALGYVKRCNAQRQRISRVPTIAVGWQQVVRGGLQHPAEGEKETELNSLLVAFDPRESGDADFGRARYIIE